jgi:hypothetical protein
MKKHIYVHTSHSSALSHIIDDSEFIHACDYSTEDLPKRIIPQEIAKIETELTVVHILVGKKHYHDLLCPWCGSETEREDYPCLYRDGWIESQLVCKKCDSKGPSVPSPSVDDEIHPGALKMYYSQKRPWDADLKNPYENAVESE